MDDAAAPDRPMGGVLLAANSADLEQLLVAIAQKDMVAFRTLYEVASPKLLGIILRIIRNKPAAEDVLQDVFVRIWQNATGFSPQAGPARAWMNSIARNRAIDVLRQKSFTPVSDVCGDVDWYERIAEDRDRESDMIGTGSLRHCLGTLDEQTRTCVLLAYYEGFSREEIAERFNRPVNTIKTWLHRSLIVLRNCLDGDEA